MWNIFMAWKNLHENIFLRPNLSFQAIFSKGLS